MKKLYNIKFFILVLFFSIASMARAMAFALDDGTAEDGTFIFPKALAMRCDIASQDVGENKTIGKCLDKVLKLGQGSREGKENIKDVFNDIYHQMNAAYFPLALQKKQIASAYEDEMDKILEGDKLAADSIPDPAADTKKKQETIARLGYMTGKNAVDIVDVYTAKIALDVMSDFQIYEMSTDSAPLEE